MVPRNPLQHGHVRRKNTSLNTFRRLSGSPSSAFDGVPFHPITQYQLASSSDRLYVLARMNGFDEAHITIYVRR